MLGRKPVVDRDDDSIDSFDEVVAVIVELGWRPAHKATAMNEEDPG
jgi:hypothetical protein